MQIESRKLLLIMCRRRCSIDSFQPYAVPIDHIGWCVAEDTSSFGVTLYQYTASGIVQFSGGDPFYSS